MSHDRKLLVILTCLSSLFYPVVNATVSVPINVYFGLPTYQTYIHFARDQTFSQLYRESDYWFFDDMGFQTQHANMTILTIGDESTEFILTGTGTCTTKIDTGNRGNPIRVEGAESWTYDASDDVITLQTAHSSDVHVTITWVTEASGYFLLTVHLTERGEPLRDVVVSVHPLESIEKETHNMTTGLAGLAQFELPYGTYLVKARHDEKVKTLRVWLTGNKDVGLDFGTPPIDQRGDLILIAVFVVIIILYFGLFRRR